MIHSPWQFRTRRLPCDVSHTVCAFCPTFSLFLAAMLMTSKGIRRGSPDSRRQGFIFALFHKMTPRVREGLSGPR